MNTKTYDRKCFDLAESFIDDHPELRGKESDLACVIQEAIENYVADETAPVVTQPAPFDMVDYADKVCKAVCGVPHAVDESELKASVLSVPDRFETT